MLNLRTRTARDIVTKAGRWPTAAATLAVVNLLVAPSFALAQPAAPAAPQAPAPAQGDKPRDPMKAKTDTKVAVSEHMTVDLHVKDEDLSNVLELLSIQTQKNIIASKSVGGKVTATLYGVTFYQALDAILHVNGFGYIENGNFIYVYTNDELKAIEAALKKRVSKVIRLNYLNANDAKEFVSPLLSKDGGEIKVNEKSKDFQISDKLPVGKDDYALGATLVVIDFEENIKAIEDLVKQLDTRPAQVLVEATILQTSLTEANAFGVDFSVIGDLNFGDFINIGGPLGAASGLIKGGTGASGQGFSPGNDRGNAVTSNPGNTSGPGTFKVGVLAGDVAIFLKMLDQVTDSVILSNPKILTLNRQPSRVLVGKRVGYLNTTSTETSTTQTVNFLDTGTQLYFRPFVSSEGEVRMELKPQVSAAEIRNVTDARGAVVTIPDEVTQEIVTNVNVRDGQTIVLGGLFTESSTFTRRQVPWVGDIPILGAAFRGHQDDLVRSEIIFLVTPTIINDGHMAAQAERYAGDIERIRAGTRQKLLPWSQDRMTDSLNVEAEKLAAEGNYDKALWNIQRSLTMNANQPQAYHLRERISGEKERWNDRSVLNEIVGSELNARASDIKPQENYQHTVPWGSKNTVREPVGKQPTTTKGSNKSIIGNSNSKDTTPVAGVDGPQSMNTAQPGSTWQQPLNNAENSDSVATTAQTDGVYRAAMSPSDSNTTFAAASSTPSTEAAAPSNTPASESTTSFAAANSTTATTPSNTPAQASETSVASTSVASASGTPAQTSPANPAEPAQQINTWSIEPAPQALASTNTNGAESNSGSFNSESTFASTSTNTLSNTAKPSSQAAASNAQPAAPLTPEAAVASVKTQLTTLRSTIELYTLSKNGATPEIGMDMDNGWKPLVDAKLVESLPINQYVGGPNASKVFIAEAPDTKFHSNYGWIFNPKTGQLWAAGFDASDKPLNKGKSGATASAPATTNEILSAISAPKPADKNQQPAPQPESSTAGVEEPKH